MPNDSERLDNGLAAGEFDSLLIFASNPSWANCALC